MRLFSIALLSLALAGCGSSQAGPTPPGDPGASTPQKTAGEKDVETRVSFSEAGTCDVPGRPEFAGQTRVRLVYVEWPRFYEEFCSSDLAERLRKTNAKEVPVTVSFDPQGRGHALCRIDTITANRLERGGCSFAGLISGGSSGYGHESKGDSQLTDADLPPWEARSRRP